MKMEKLKTTTLLSVLDEEETILIDKMEQFHFTGESESNQKIQSFHRLQYNESIVIRMKHSSYSWWPFNSSQCVITFIFLDKMKFEKVRFTIIPGAAEIKIVCPRFDADYATFPDNTYSKYYKFVIIFSSVGIMLFYMEDFYVRSVKCISGIVDIMNFKHTVYNTEGFEVMLEVRSKSVRIPANWRIVRHIPINHKIIIRYYPDVKNVITIRLADGNGITAFTVIINYEKGIISTKRERLDDKEVQCVNFVDTIRFVTPMLGRIEIGIFPHSYTVGMKIDKGKSKTNMRECLVIGHHLSPYDIRQTILDSTNKKMVAYAYDVSLA